MSKKFEISGNDLVITDTDTSAIDYQGATLGVSFNNHQLASNAAIYIEEQDGSKNPKTSPFNCLLSVAVDSTLTPFTEATFRSFASQNFNSASGGSEALRKLMAYNGIISDVTGILSINADPTKFDVAGFTYMEYDKTDPQNIIEQQKTFAGQTGITGTLIGLDKTTFVYLRLSDSSIVQLEPPQGGKRLYTHLIIGNLNTDPTDSFFSDLVPTPQMGYNLESTVEAVIRALGGVNISPIAVTGNADLTFQSGVGDAVGMGRNADIDLNIPNIEEYGGEAVAGTIPGFMVEVYENGSGDLVPDVRIGKTLDPVNYNNGGTLSAVGSAKWSIKRLFFFYRDSVWVSYYGNDTYNTSVLAKSAVITEVFNENQQTFEAVFVGWMLMKGDATVTNDLAFAEFVPKMRTRI